MISRLRRRLLLAGLLAPTLGFLWALPAAAHDVGAWAKAKSAPEERSEVGVGEIDGKVYVVGDIGRKTTLLVYDIASDNWSTGAAFPYPVHHPITAVHDGLLYVFGGYNADLSVTDKSWTYDPATDTWTALPRMPTARASGGAGVIDGRIHVVSGVQDAKINAEGGKITIDAGNVNVHEVYDIATRSWSTRAPIPVPRDHLAAGVIDGKLVVAGGRFGMDPVVNIDLVDIYDPQTDSWSRGARMPTPRSGMAFTVLDKELYTFGGEARTRVHSEAESYHLPNDVWNVHPPLPTGRHGFGAVTHEGRIITLTGTTKHFGSGGEAPVEIYTPGTAE